MRSGVGERQDVVTDPTIDVGSVRAEPEIGTGRLATDGYYRCEERDD